MATRLDGRSEAERIREVIRQLNLDLEQCQKLLTEAEASVRQSRQDNDPPSWRLN